MNKFILFSKILNIQHHIQFLLPLLHTPQVKTLFSLFIRYAHAGVRPEHDGAHNSIAHRWEIISAKLDARMSIWATRLLRSGLVNIPVSRGTCIKREIMSISGKLQSINYGSEGSAPRDVNG